MLGALEIFKTGEDTDFISRAKRVAKMISVEEGAQFIRQTIIYQMLARS